MLGPNSRLRRAGTWCSESVGNIWAKLPTLTPRPTNRDQIRMIRKFARDGVARARPTRTLDESDILGLWMAVVEVGDCSLDLEPHRKEDPVFDTSLQCHLEADPQHATLSKEKCIRKIREICGSHGCSITDLDAPSPSDEDVVDAWWEAKDMMNTFGDAKAIGLLDRMGISYDGGSDEDEDGVWVDKPTEDGEEATEEGARNS